jgi:hypothetical protein
MDKAAAEAKSNAQRSTLNIQRESEGRAKSALLRQQLEVRF